MKSGWSLQLKVMGISYHFRYFNAIKETCDQLELTKMMCYKYDWNKEIICPFYSTFYFDVDGHRLI
jgi:hypothetical protein